MFCGTEWRVRQRPHGREDLTSLSLGRNITMVSSVLKTRTEGKQNCKALDLKRDDWTLVDGCGEGV